MVIEKLLFLSFILKTELVASKFVTANNRFPYSERFVGEDEKYSTGCVSLISDVSCGGIVFVCSKSVLMFFD